MGTLEGTNSSSLRGSVVTSDHEPIRFPGHEYPQVIPRPPYLEVGEPAPWTNSPLRHEAFTVAQVDERLRAAGRHASQGAAPDTTAELTDVADGEWVDRVTRRSAVLVTLFNHDGEAQVILTRRAAHLRHHRDEVAFPGGRVEDGESVVDTALREAHEEVGLSPSAVTVRGWLEPLVTLASGSAIWPVVATLDEPPTLVPDPVEVARIFTVSLRNLLDPATYHQERWRRETPRPGSAPDGSFPMSFFRVPGEIVWGATARILVDLLTVLTDTRH